MTKEERIQEAISSVGAEAVHLAVLLADLSDPDGAWTHLTDMGEFEAAEAIEIIYFN